MSEHVCHAEGCQVQIPPELFMCNLHWWMVPRPLRQQITLSYRPGQCDDKKPSKEWVEAAQAAIAAVKEKEAERERRRAGEAHG